MLRALSHKSIIASMCVAAILAFVACGRSEIGSPAPFRVVTPEHSGQTFEMEIGWGLRVQLTADYQQPSARPTGVLERTSAEGGYPTKEPVIAVFRAVKPGRVDVESSTDYACLHATPSCALPQQLWSVHVIVKR